MLQLREKGLCHQAYCLGLSGNWSPSQLHQTRQRGLHGIWAFFRAWAAICLLFTLAVSFASLANPARAWASGSSWQYEGWCASGSYDTSWYTGLSSSYKLNSAAQLAGLAYLVNCENKSMEGVTIYLGSDIDLSGKQWVPIGSAYNNDQYFSGTFDGQGHTISGLSISNTRSYQALFGMVKSAVVRNLVVKGNVTGCNNIAGIVSYSEDSSFRNLANYVNVMATGSITDLGTYIGNAAGVVCYASTVNPSKSQYFDNLYNYGTVSAAGKNSGGVIGFIHCQNSTGETPVKITRCANYGDVSVSTAQNVGEADAGVGGVVGATSSIGTFQISECVNQGTVSTANMYSTGGIVGSLGGQSSYITYSYNTGTVNGALASGGIAGNMQASDAQVAGCYNVGDVVGVTASGIVANSTSNASDYAYNNFYLDSTALGAFGASDLSGGGDALTQTELSSDSTLSALNSQADKYVKNESGNAYPYLGWQVSAVAGGGIKGDESGDDTTDTDTNQATGGSSIFEAFGNSSAGTSANAGNLGDAAGSENGQVDGVDAATDSASDSASEDASSSSASDNLVSDIEDSLNDSSEDYTGEIELTHLVALEEVDTQEDETSEMPVVDITDTQAMLLALGVLLLILCGAYSEYVRFAWQGGKVTRGKLFARKAAGAGAVGAAATGAAAGAVGAAAASAGTAGTTAPGSCSAASTR